MPFDRYLARRQRAGEHAHIPDAEALAGPMQRRRWRAGEFQFIGDDDASAPEGPMALRRQRAGEGSS